MVLSRTMAHLNNLDLYSLKYTHIWCIIREMRKEEVVGPSSGEVSKTGRVSLERPARTCRLPLLKVCCSSVVKVGIESTLTALTSNVICNWDAINQETSLCLGPIIRNIISLFDRFPRSSSESHTLSRMSEVGLCFSKKNRWRLLLPRTIHWLKYVLPLIRILQILQFGILTFP